MYVLEFETGPSMPIREGTWRAYEYDTDASYARAANILHMIENQTCKQNVIHNHPPPPPFLNATVILTEVILMDYNIYIILMTISSILINIYIKEINIYAVNR